MDFSQDRMQNARRFVVRTCRFILNSSIDRLIKELTIRGPLRRSPSKYKVRTPAIGAFINYCNIKGIDPENEWKQWDGFPYIIAKGSSTQPQFKRSYHPDLFQQGKKEIDRLHYVKEILGASNRFGIELNENEAIQGRFIIPLTEFFDAITIAFLGRFVSYRVQELFGTQLHSTTLHYRFVVYQFL